MQSEIFKNYNLLRLISIIFALSLLIESDILILVKMMLILLHEFVEFIDYFNPLSKWIAKGTCNILLLLSLAVLFFAITAGRVYDYYYCLEAIRVISENIRSVAGVGFFSAILIEVAHRKQFDQAN